MYCVRVKFIGDACQAETRKLRIDALMLPIFLHYITPAYKATTLIINSKAISSLKN